jgi:hypothetical protein
MYDTGAAGRWIVPNPPTVIPAIASISMPAVSIPMLQYTFGPVQRGPRGVVIATSPADRRREAEF